MTGTDPISYSTSIAWLDGCSGAYVSTFSRGIWRIDVTLRTATVPAKRPTRQCEPEHLCRIRELVMRYLLTLPRPPVDPRGIFVSDGFITRVQRVSRVRTRVSVTPGSIVTYVGGRPRGVSVKSDPRATRPRRRAVGVFFSGRKQLPLRRRREKFRLLSPPARLGRGVAAPPVDERARLEVQADALVNGTFTPVLPAGERLVVRGTILKPPGEPVELRIDGAAVAKYPAETKTFEFVDPDGFPRPGVAHTLELLTTGSKPQLLDSVRVHAANAEEEEGRREGPG